MYHELLLHASIPSYRHTQVLSILAGVTAQPPAPIQQRQYILAPRRMPAPSLATKGGSQEIGNKRQVKEVGDVYMLRLVHELEEDDDTDDEEDDGEKGADDDVNMADTGNKDGEQELDSSSGAQAGNQTQPHDTNVGATAETSSKVIPQQGKWQLRFYDTPEPGKRSVTSRLAQVTDIVEGDAFAFVNGMGYSCTTRYATSGHTFVHNNIVLHLYRILSLPTSHTVGEAWTTAGKDIKPLDANDGYLLEAKVRLLDGGQPDLVAQGTQELTQFRETMKGTLDLRVADRLSLDTKVAVR